ncbi:MAG: hypothetical protein KBD50_02910 [Candidatus Pacebacteria bacterium]|nr:hypothetical protein [Candidatus Paceibacterota bacterium]
MSALTMIKNSIAKIFSGWKLRSRRTLVVVVLVILAVIGFFLLGSNKAEPEAEAGLPQVEVVSVGAYAKGALGVAVPTANGNSFVIRAEAGGKITRAAQTGAVAQGTIVAQLESSAQQAALTQAEGAYEAAVAASGGNANSQEAAQKGAVRTWTSATVAAAKTIRSSIDIFYGDVRSSQGASGFKLQAFGAADEFNTARTAVEKIFDRWETDQINESNSSAKLNELSGDLAQIGTLVDRIAALIPRQEISGTYSESDRTDDATSLGTARASITALQADVDSARTAIANASNTGSASAQAVVKQALGALEAVRSSYAKTIIRAPFAGTLVAVNVRAGDVISTGSDIAIITPKEGVETTRSFALPLSAVKYSPAGAFVFLVNAEGILESREVQTGLVTANSISVEGLDGSEQIVKDVRGLKSGEAVVIIEQ